MRRRSLVILAATAWLMLGVFGTPATAQNIPRIAFVNGIPGRTVDVCVGRQEVKSRLRYGAWFERTFDVGSRVVRFRSATDGRCSGTILGAQTVALAIDADLTLVATTKPDTVLVWDNMSSPSAINPNGWLAIRHAGDLGSVVFAKSDDVVVSALPSALTKGQERRIAGFGNASFWLTATGLDQAEPMATGHYQVVEGRRLEVILVGSKPGNARLIAVYRTRIPF